MGDSFDRIQQAAVGEWRAEQAKIILEIERLLMFFVDRKHLKKWKPQWIHLLREAGKVSHSDDWAGKVKAIGNHVNTTMAAASQNFNKISEDLQNHETSIQAQLEELRREATETQAHMKEEMAEMRKSMDKVSHAMERLIHHQHHQGEPTPRPSSSK